LVIIKIDLMENETFVFDKRLDIEYLESIYEGDKDYAAVVFEQFMLSYPEQLAAIEESFVKQDISAYKGNIHKIKATFSFVGLSKLTDLAEIIEKNCGENYDANTLSTLHIDFKNNLNELIPIIESELKRLQA
jgi:HPt (histidine-containing phosphotransfer) domain-containing protein